MIRALGSRMTKNQRSNFSEHAQSNPFLFSGNQHMGRTWASTGAFYLRMRKMSGILGSAPLMVSGGFSNG